MKSKSIKKERAHEFSHHIYMEFRLFHERTSLVVVLIYCWAWFFLSSLLRNLSSSCFPIYILYIIFFYNIFASWFMLRIPFTPVYDVGYSPYIKSCCVFLVPGWLDLKAAGLGKESWSLGAGSWRTRWSGSSTFFSKTLYSEDGRRGSVPRPHKPIHSLYTYTHSRHETPIRVVAKTPHLGVHDAKIYLKLVANVSSLTSAQVYTVESRSRDLSM